jgi:hypothetical protein
MNTIITQGRFVSDGTNRIIPLRQGCDWFEIIDATQAVAQPGGGNSTMTRMYWQRGMAAGTGLGIGKTGASDALQEVAMAANTGFTWVELAETFMVPGAPIAVTAGTNATQPVYSTANTAALTNGGIVRLVGSAHTNIHGMDFSVDTVIANTSFRLANALATAPGVIAGAAGFWRFIAPDLETYQMYYPSRRAIVNITAANPAVITTSVDHGFFNNMRVRINVPAACGMIEMNGLEGTVTVINASTFSVDIDSTAFTAFNFPLPGAVPFTYSEVVPMGQTPRLLVPSWAASKTNTTELGYGLLLQGGLALVGAAANGPAGINGDIMYWRAGKSFNM